MATETRWYVKVTDGKVYGPANLATLVEWAQVGRIQPNNELSRDGREWTLAEEFIELDLKWLIELKPGQFYGPYNRKLIVQLFKDGVLSPEARYFRLHELPPDQDPPPRVVEKVVEKVVERPWWFIWPWKREKSPASPFANMSREQLRRLESAAQREVVRSRELKMQQQLKMQEQKLIEG